MSGSNFKEGVKFSVSMGKIFFDKNQICIIVLSKFREYPKVCVNLQTDVR